MADRFARTYTLSHVDARGVVPSGATTRACTTATNVAAAEAEAIGENTSGYRTVGTENTGNAGENAGKNAGTTAENAENNDLSLAIGTETAVPSTEGPSKGAGPPETSRATVAGVGCFPVAL